MGAVPLAGAIAQLSWLKGHPIAAFFVRKKPKEHGARLAVEGLANTGPIVCACFGVGRNTICDTIAGGARSAADIGAKLKAGTNCGSCIPELKRLIAQTGTRDPEQRKLAAAN